MISRKQNVVDQTVKGIDFLMNKNKIKVYHGTGSFVDSSTIKIDNSSSGVTNITFNNAVIATGSKPTNLPFAKIDKKRIITST